MLQLKHVHHIAIICSDLKASIQFYTEILGCTILHQQYRQERDSYKVDLSLNGHYLLELFTFPQHTIRPTQPEALGLRHLAFAVQNLDENVAFLSAHSIPFEAIRIDDLTQKRFTFFRDPDQLPIELYEI